ncbi:trypsin-like peptidase domain-containing protein [Streptomyces herbicida]|uniref:trypsin-like peptidase domain-containing protein n=1 Tax=Streptomyces herbicida TaxID=3065675 RepID=UPI00292E6031|nr:trypsin-like peptidase domain-containing protein [Streptomyces sp. NEAU-HV9]
MAVRGPRTGCGRRSAAGALEATDGAPPPSRADQAGRQVQPGCQDQSARPDQPRPSSQLSPSDPSPAHAQLAHRRRRGPDRVLDDSGSGSDASLVRISDPAGRPRGTGFLADHHGTVVTSHEVVDGLPRLVLHAAGERTCVVTADAVTPLPALDLALVRTEGLGVDPLPITVRKRIGTGTYVRIAADRWREARVLGATRVTYTAADRFHLLGDAMELAIGTAGRDALRPGGGAAGGPVLDAETGAVLGVLGTALRSDQRDVGFAVQLRPAPGPLAELLARNAATVPAYGADLNLAGVLELTATSIGQDGPPGALDGHAGRVGAGGPGPVELVERVDAARELAAFAAGGATVLGLVGAPGSGRTTEFAALAARRGRGTEPAPTLWLRGADLKDGDESVADAVRRTLERAARIVAASRSLLPGDLGDITPERLARLAGRAGRPLLLLLDGPEEMPPVLAHRLSDWTEGTVAWLRETGARLVVACREEHWEGAGARFPRELLHPYVPADAPHPLPPCVRLTDLTPDEAHLARSRYAVPDGALVDRDARHPLTLRLLSEVRAALPDAPPTTGLDRHDVLCAHLDLMCLRIAVRLAAENGLRGTAVRRLAARVSGQIHEAARRSLGPGHGELDRKSFEAVFPWGPAPARLGGGSGWANAVLAEGLLVPAGGGYRFAHEEFADWIQGMHLDLDEALQALVHRRTPPKADPLPVPHHRVGPVVQALLLLPRQHGARQLARRMDELIHALDAGPASWWAARLLAQTLLRVPDATPYTAVLRVLADRIVTWRRRQRPVPAEFGPSFWTALPVPDPDRFELLRGLVLADEAPPEPGGADGGRSEGPDGSALDVLGARPGGPRYLDAVARLLAADPTAVQPHLIRWFDDERPLPATPHATVATAAQALLHTHRHGALDELTEVLVNSAHRRSDELLFVLAEDEPSAMCRAVDRWAHDARAARRVAAVTYGLRAAPHVRTEAERELLRRAALALLARPVDRSLHGGALALLVRDPRTRARHLPQALRLFASGDPQVPPSALIPALATHPDPVLDAFRDRVRVGPDAGEALRTLADVTTPALARRVAALVREAVVLRPDIAGHVAAYVDRSLDHGPAARAVLLPLVTGLLDAGPERVRAAVAAVLAAPGTPASRPLRRELLEFLLAHEREPDVLDALLHAVAYGGEDVRDLVHRTGLLLVRTPDGATRFDRGLVDLGRHVPGFAVLMARWLADTPDEWAAVVGPSTRRMIGNLAGVRVLA